MSVRPLSADQLPDRSAIYRNLFESWVFRKGDFERSGCVRMISSTPIRRIDVPFTQIRSRARLASQERAAPVARPAPGPVVLDQRPAHPRSEGEHLRRVCSRAS